MDTIKEYWETVYETKNPDQVSWTQNIPKTSLDFIHSFFLNKTAKIIDIGGGDSKLADHLLDEGYEHITVLDISAKALEKAKLRLGKRAEKIKWIVSDITDFEPTTTYDLWHDRATFHFLTNNAEIKKYIDIVHRSVSGFLVIATFSDKGPQKCSGLTIKQYNEGQLVKQFISDFDKLRCFREDHITPFNTLQNFQFCSFSRRSK